MKYRNKYFKLYPHVKLVKGYNRSIIMDLYATDSHFIPNFFLELLETIGEKQSLDDFIIFNSLQSSKDEIASFFEFLIESDLGILCDEIVFDGLTPMLTEFQNDNIIENVIIEIDKLSNWNINMFLKELNSFGSRFLELRFLDAESVSRHLVKILTCLETHSIESVHAILPFCKNLMPSIFESLKNFHRLQFITVYNTPTNFDRETIKNVTFTTQKSIESDQCGQISITDFKINIPIFVRNNAVNNCLAHKLSVDRFGNIKNCPSSKTSFGAFKKLKLFDIVTSLVFTKEWNSTKDKILICSDCEFRMMCSDCRVFIQDESDRFSKPSKCGYNPYIRI